MSRPRPARARRAAPPLEKVVQSHIVALLHIVGAKVYVLGTRRSRGRKCPTCATFVPEDQGTHQTPGIPDLWAFLPARTGQCRGLWIEAKRSVVGRASEEQLEFASLCRASGLAHVMGDLDAVIAWLLREGYLRRDQVPHYRLPAEA